MNVTCEACRTNFDAPEEQASIAACPCCEHVNRPRPSVATATSSPSDRKTEDEPIKTMIFPAEGDLSDTGITEVERLRSQGRPEVSRALALTVVEPGRPSREIPIDKPRVTIGRGPCDIRLHDAEVSREHCMIEVFDGIPTLKDLHSANGTLLNGHLIREHVLKDGDEVKLGSALLTLTVRPSA
ncbi:MAG: FHA domain-containing protein [Nitrospiria bacterium]